MDYILINITEKRAVVSGAPSIVCGNDGYILNLTFDEEWSGEAYKTARFVYVQGGEVKCTDVVFTGSMVEVPPLLNTREVMVGVYAGNLRTTTPARIPCEPSIRCGTAEPEDPTPSQYDQIIQLLNESAGGGSGGTGSPYAVQYIPQTLTDAQKEQAQKNIGVVPETVHYTEQYLTDAQKAQARENLGVDNTQVVTINGKTLKFFVGKNSEYNQLTPDEKADLFAIITDDTSKADLDTLKEKVSSMDTTVSGLTDGTTSVGKATTATGIAPNGYTLTIENGVVKDYVVSPNTIYLLIYGGYTFVMRTGSGVIYDAIMGHSTTASARGESVLHFGCTGKRELTLYKWSISSPTPEILTTANGTVDVYKLGTTS